MLNLVRFVIIFGQDKQFEKIRAFNLICKALYSITDNSQRMSNDAELQCQVTDIHWRLLGAYRYRPYLQCHRRKQSKTHSYRYGTSQ